MCIRRREWGGRAHLVQALIQEVDAAVDIALQFAEWLDLRAGRKVIEQTMEKRQTMRRNLKKDEIKL